LFEYPLYICWNYVTIKLFRDCLNDTHLSDEFVGFYPLRAKHELRSLHIKIKEDSE